MNQVQSFALVMHTATQTQGCLVSCPEILILI